MDDTRAIEILTALLKKEGTTDEEKEALREAIGMLAWSKLIPNRIKQMKERRERKARDDDGSML